MAVTPQTRALARRLARLERQMLQQKQPTLGFSSIEEGSLAVRDENGTVRQTIGIQPDGTYTTVDTNAPPPPTPAAPTADGTTGRLVISSFGQTADGANWPADVYRIDIHVSKTAGFSPTVATMVGTFTPGIGGTFSLTVPSANAGLHYVKLVAVNTSMVQSQPSSEVSVDVLAIDAVSQAMLDAEAAAIRSEVAAGDSALSQEIDLAVSDFNAGLATKSKHTLSANAPGATANNAGDVWERHKAGDTTKIIGRWRGAGGTAWTVMNLDATYIPQLDIGTGTVGDLVGSRILAKSIGVDKLIVSDFTNYVPDPSCTGSGWTFFGTGGQFRYDLADKNGVADGAVRFTASGAYQDCRSNFFPVTPGEELSMSADWLRNTSSDGTLYVRIYWFNSSGAAVNNAAGTAIYDTFFTASGTTATVYSNGVVASTGSRAAGSWHTETGFDRIVPSEARQAKVYAIRSGSYAVGDWYVDNVAVRRRFGGELIVDGELEAKHMKTDLMRSLIVRGDLLETNADPLLGIKISTSGILGYDSQVGSPTYKQARFIVNPTTGLVTMKGGLIESATLTGVLVQGGTFETTGNLNANRVKVTADGAVGKVMFYSGDSLETGPAEIASQDPGSGPPYISMLSGRTSAEPHFASIGINSGATAQQSFGQIVAGQVQLGLRAGGAPTVTVGDSGNGVAQFRVYGELHSIGGNNGLFDDYWAGGGVTNAQVNNSGRFIRGSSSRRLKKEIETLDIAEARKLYDVRSVRYKWVDEENMGARPFAGHIAEEMHEAGAHLWTSYDINGDPSGVHYPEMVAGLLVLIKEHERENGEQAAQIASLLDRVQALEGTIAS